MGRNQEAYLLARKSFDQIKPSEITKYSWGSWISMSFVYSRIGENKQAIKLIERALDLFPWNNNLVRNAMDIYNEAEQYKNIISLFKNYTAGKELRSIEDGILGYAGIAYFRTGNRSEAVRILNVLLFMQNDFYRNASLYFAAAMYTAMGEKEKPLQLLERSYERRDLTMANINMDPLFRPLHGDLRFEALLRKVGFN